MGEELLYWNIGVMEWWKNKEWKNGIMGVVGSDAQKRAKQILQVTHYSINPLFHCCSEYAWVIYDRSFD
jgi:hypothetical protein